MIFEDQLAALEADSKKVGTQGGELDFALLVDGLAAEREQGITIDVAYRFFSTDKRKFIVADTPGHEQYTRNMVTGASTADLAVILIDARKGVLTQTRRHSYLGLADRSPQGRARDQQDRPRRLRRGDVRQDRRGLHARSPGRSASRTFVAIPVSGLRGDNITAPSRAHAVVPRPDADGVSGDGGDRGRRAASARCACRCSGSTARTSTSAASPARWSSGSRAPGRAGAGAALGAREHRRPHRHHGRRPGPRGRRAVGDAHARRRDRHQPRRCDREARSTCPGWRTSSRRWWCGCRTSRCCPGARTGSRPAPSRSPPPSPSPSTRSTSTRSSTSRRRSSN